MCHIAEVRLLESNNIFYALCMEQCCPLGLMFDTVDLNGEKLLSDKSSYSGILCFLLPFIMQFLLNMLHLTSLSVCEKQNSRALKQHGLTIAAAVCRHLKKL